MKRTSSPNPLLTPISLLALATGTLQAVTVSTIGTTGVFDSTSNANSIDVENPSSTLAAFKTTVSTAYSNDLGGVIDWSTGAGTLSNSGTSPGNFLDTTVSVSYGTGAGQTLTLTPDRAIGIYTNNVSNQVLSLSDTTAIVSDGGNDPIGLAFNLALSGADVVEIGAGMLSRSTYGLSGVTGVNFRATATFSDTSTSVIDYALTASGTDTFLHFVAPTGETITSFGVTWLSETGGTLLNGQRRPVMDDFGFVVAVPEPSAALLSLAGLGLLFRRRR